METEYQIKITGGINIPEKLETTKSVMVSVEAEIYEAAKRDKQDGSYLMTYKGRAVGFPLISQGEKKYKASIRSKQSRLWRWKIQEFGEDYESFMQTMLDNADEVIDFIKELRQK